MAVWCPCHGSADTPCVLRGDQPIITREICDCTAVRYVKGRDGSLSARHQPGCELRDSDPRRIDRPGPRIDRPGPRMVMTPASTPRPLATSSSVSALIVDTPTRHTCHAKGCGRACKPEHLMCAPCWALVPRPLQAAVYKHYRPGQCDDMRPSKEWFKAADAAIIAVVNAREEQKKAKRERRALPGQLSFDDADKEK